jgi:hypothetical protein
VYSLPTISLATGVGIIKSDNPNPISPMRGLDGASWYNKCLAGVVFSFQISKHLVERQVDDPSNIFANDPTGPCFSNNPKHLRPEVTVILIASSLPGKTERLAWESTRKEVEVFDFTSLEIPDVIVNFCIFEILFNYRLAKFIVVAEADVLVFVAPNPLRRERETADA